MKCSLVLLFIAVYTNFCLADYGEGLVPPEVTECLKENGLDDEYLRKVMKENQNSLIDESKCFSFCIMKKTNLLDDSKHIKFDVFKTRMNLIVKPEEVEKLDKIGEMCPDIHSEMDCDKARTLEKCISEM